MVTRISQHVKHYPRTWAPLGIRQYLAHRALVCRVICGAGGDSRFLQRQIIESRIARLAHGYMICFGFCCGGTVHFNGPMGLRRQMGTVLRRPLEAMTRTLPLVFFSFCPWASANYCGNLYIWSRYTDWATALGIRST